MKTFLNFKPSFISLICVLLLLGCEKSPQGNEELMKEVQTKMDENMQVTKESNKMIAELQSEVRRIQTNSPHVSNQISIIQFLNMSLVEKNEIIKHYFHSRMGGRQLSDFDLYMMAFLHNLFNVEDVKNRFLIREEVEIDNKIVLLNRNPPDELGEYMVIYFTKPVDILDKESDALAIYVYQNELYMSVYQQNEFIEGYRINPKFYKDMFIKVGQLKMDLLEIQCAQRPDC
ncbi:hypothetical protein [Paenibacillus eucommiae]|uniref:Lipoprotein n=1 Tax=Paenibacillus eucommiae TaxID=1355755 RepID=A0ABS4J4P3_9BACL|nr:hypothetical protein [Paenibacillus eucommiae]MBP1994255.1 hypothetical protein [Paenibacillus eucommiae]